MSNFIKKFENFSADLNDKAQKTEHDVDAGDEENKEMTLDQFKKCHKYILSGEWDEREDEKDFDSRQKDLEKYKNLSDTEKNKYLTDLEVSDSTVLENINSEHSNAEETDVLEIKVDGSYFGHVTKDNENNYFTHGQLGEDNEYSDCEELFKYLSNFGGFGFDDIYWA